MANKQVLQNILVNESLKALKNHAEFYDNLPVVAVKLLTECADKKDNDPQRASVPVKNTQVSAEVNLKPQNKEPEKVKAVRTATDQVVSEISPDLEIIKKEVATCTSCGLHKTRTQTVFGVGSNRIPLVCIGEAPGEEEDKSGVPFVGKAGQLLTKMLEAISISRDDIFICNVLKCRPPMNRDPNSEEVASCSGYLDRQLTVLKPQYILALGRIAAKRLLNLDYTMAQFRTQLHEYKGIPVLVTYHPSALLRNPNWKQPAWEDLQKLQKLLGL